MPDTGIIATLSYDACDTCEYNGHCELEIGDYEIENDMLMCHNYIEAEE